MTQHTNQQRPQEDSHALRVYETLDIVILAIFTVELAVNIVLYWFKPFWSDGCASMGACVCVCGCVLVCVFACVCPCECV